MEINVLIRIYEELNSFLPPDRERKDFSFKIASKTSLQDLLNRLEIPSSLVDLVLINGKSVKLTSRLNDGDRISVYPVFETLNISALKHIHDMPLRRLKFVCDVHLGKLAKYLRMLGLDTYYENSLSYNQLIEISVKEHRIILTKDRKLLKDTLVSRGYRVKQIDSKSQVKEIISYFDLKENLSPLSRCLRCNFLVRAVKKDFINESVPPSILETHDKFMQCDVCNRIYWKGSHYRSMMSWIKDIIDWFFEF